MKINQPGRSVVELNDSWIYFDENLGAKKIFSVSAAKGRKVSLPHTKRVFPHHNFDEKSYQNVSWYRTSFKLGSEARGKKVFAEFDGVMLAAKVFLNGKPVGEHKGGFTGFRLDLTKCVKFTGENVLAVEVDSRERPDIPPFGQTVDYLTFGGIYREARIIIVETTYIMDIFPVTLNVLQNSRALLVQFDIQNEGPARELEAVAELLDDQGKTVASGARPLKAGKKQTLLENICLQELAGIRLWDIDEPTLYTVRLTLRQDGKTIDQMQKTIGFREAHFAKDGKFYLNGRHVKLIGLDRHQNYPYVGPAMGWRMQYRDAEILKNDLGLNIVRTSHYPQSPHFLDRCDQLGLLVLEEIPGWGHIGDEKWKDVSCRELQEMIVRDRHHPSIVLWGVRINESKDDHDFYTRTNQLAHQLDPTRQTGGIRNLRDSEMLEDVFTYNDFSGRVLDPNHIPYLITEFAGHTFPTKSFDSSQRQADHALLHARIQNQQMGNSQVAGAIGWCAFDYNTHIEFGAGDRICYHGVCDIFRLPKIAANFYSSQKDPKKEVVLELAEQWVRGDWNDFRRFFLVFSNCDELQVRLGDAEPIVLQPNRERFGHLPHPPFLIDKLEEKLSWSNDELTLIGKIKGKAVIKKKYHPDKLPVEIRAWTDHAELNADGRDMTQLSFMMVDRLGHLCPYATGAVTAEASGGVELIGENPFALVGGRGAIYIRSGRKRGSAEVTLTASSGQEARINIKLV